MEYFIVALIGLVCIGLLFFIAKRFVTKTYPKKTEKLFADIKNLETLGFKFTGDKYEGLYRNFYVYIFVTTNMKNSDQVMVMVATNTNSGPFDFLKTFTTGYFKNSDGGACTYVSFRLFMRLLFDPAQGVQRKLDKLIDLLNEKMITPYQIG